MIIRRCLNDHGTFEPEAACWLGAIPEAALFHVAQCVRHPVSTYRLSLTKIRERALGSGNRARKRCNSARNSLYTSRNKHEEVRV